jgi:AsmA-like C-terminal region
VLGGLLDLSGLRPEWPATDGGFRGHWSEQPLALPLLDRFDGELMLSSKGGLAGEGLELTARLEQGRLTVEHVALALWQGRLQGQLSVEVRRALPYLVADLKLEAFDPTKLADLLGVPSLVAAPATLHLAATGAGDDVRTLVRSLIGQVEFVAQDGVLRDAMPEDFAGSAPPPGGQGGAAEPAHLEASFPLERGILVARPMELDLGGLETRLEGTVDLYLWAVDLTLQSAGGGPVLKVVGPLHRPQVRLLGAAAPAPDSPEPRASP